MGDANGTKQQPKGVPEQSSLNKKQQQQQKAKIHHKLDCNLNTVACQFPGFCPHSGTLPVVGTSLLSKKIGFGKQSLIYLPSILNVAIDPNPVTLLFSYHLSLASTNEVIFTYSLHLF